MDSARLQPVLLSGVFIGVLSALPFINCCCCLWVLAGGALTVYLRQQNVAGSIPAAEGALLGLMAGFMGGVLAALLSIPIQMVMGPIVQGWVSAMMAANNEVPAETREMIEKIMSSSGRQVLNAIFSIIASTVFGMLGGLLGVAVFKKNAPPPPPTVIPHEPDVVQ
ncbi:MAG: hypothetical protein H0W08_10685 [Acidobacteria bacterium]|nr:hypothetical protein [Acidobacteriota bacterium]